MSDPSSPAGPSALGPEPAPAFAGLLTVAEAAGVLRIGRNTCYELIRIGLIPHVRLGRLIRVPRFGLESWLSRQAGLSSDPSSVVSFTAQPH